MTCACRAWEFMAETHLLKLQRLQNKVLATTDNLLRFTSVRDKQGPNFDDLKISEK
jgi:hypothetical protein